MSSAASDAGAWRDARWMPAMSDDLRALVVVRFALGARKRLGELRAEFV